LFQGLPVNDYDVYIQDMDVLIRLAQHYYPGTTTTGVDKVLDGRKREDYLNNIQSSFEIDDNESEEAVRYKTLKLDQVKLNISSIGMKKSLKVKNTRLLSFPKISPLQKICRLY
jgi:hypothetical protein